MSRLVNQSVLSRNNMCKLFSSLFIKYLFKYFLANNDGNNDRMNRLAEKLSKIGVIIEI